MQTGDLFHPKFYLFENSPQDWACLIGSANFTKSAFNTNIEACILIGSADDADGSFKNGLDKTIQAYWSQAHYIDADQFARYKTLRDRFRPKLKALSGTFGDQHLGRPIVDVPLLNISWKEYVHKVQADRLHSVDGRILVLEEARNFFRQYKTFNQMPLDVRRGIAGTGGGIGDTPWGWFGSMFGAGVFKNLVKTNNQYLSIALNNIPMAGEVRKENYLAFIDDYIKAFPNQKRHGLGTATRLLAMKRPDYFVCFDSANKEGLCDAFAITLYGHAYERYWDSIVERIFVSSWWNAPRPEDGNEAKIWDGRAAFLDSLFYKEAE